MKIKPVLYQVLAIAFMCSIVIYAGHFLFKRPDKKALDAVENIHGNQSQPFKYEHRSSVFKNRKQEMHIIEINPTSSRVMIKPVLSFDKIYGFEYLSVMASRNNAYAAVNAGFFHEYGYPSGMVVTDGNIITSSTGKYPVFVYDGKKAFLSQFKTRLYLKSGSLKLPLDGINRPGRKYEKILYTNAYGSSNRVDSYNISFLITNNIVQKCLYKKGSTAIPPDSAILTVSVATQADLPDDFNFREGDRLELLCEPEIGDKVQAYECGSWLIKDGKISVPKRDEWVGVMTNHDPRTAIGIKRNGNVVLFVVDGRQPGYSEGMTGLELAEYLLEYGAENAAMLDGGASTEMIVEGKIVNKPSYRGSERLLGGGLIIRYSE